MHPRLIGHRPADIGGSGQQHGVKLVIDHRIGAVRIEPDHINIAPGRFRVLITPSPPGQFRRTVMTMVPDDIPHETGADPAIRQIQSRDMAQQCHMGW
ncbi:hypothetical protein GCM10011505_47500 [Tistrella bauzanensis]|uniref:Uncharacterized protein n=1 Tax=Tistrella bauzanensis TaxID=657419 RepID=A0ABQ1JA55_9PROT|nr:hypothetical protein GCM10011505_47500 [Tistrella bauzanensis]